jgi:hypothetical protein
VQDTSPGQVIIYLVRHLGIQLVHKDVAESVAISNSVVVHHCSHHYLPGLTIVSKHKEVVFRRFVYGAVQGFLHVSDNDP